MAAAVVTVMVKIMVERHTYLESADVYFFFSIIFCLLEMRVVVMVVTNANCGGDTIVVMEMVMVLVTKKKYDFP